MDSIEYPKGPFVDDREDTNMSSSESLLIAASVAPTSTLAVRDPPKPQKLRFVDVSSASSEALSPFTDKNAVLRAPETLLLPALSPEEEVTEMKSLRWGTTRRPAGRPNSRVGGSESSERLYISDSCPRKAPRCLPYESHERLSTGNADPDTNGIAGSDFEGVANTSFNCIDEFAATAGAADMDVIKSKDSLNPKNPLDPKDPKEPLDPNNPLDPNDPLDPKDHKSEERILAFNRGLPLQLLDPETGLPTKAYPRNKIRTAKYTALSFFPKNVYGQFSRDVANSYFLFLIILGVFAIFGVPSPGLAAVPLIFIVCITALKDSVEDSKRTATDIEVNNQPTHILTQVRAAELGYVYQNVNVCDESVSLWRKVKKWSLRQMFAFISFMLRVTHKSAAKVPQQVPQDNVRNRKSFDSVAEFNRHSFVSTATNRKSCYRGLMLTRKTMAFSRKKWKEVRVGDIVRIHNNEEVPADIMILLSSDEDACCFVETKNLDGETNLKVKQAMKLSGHCPLRRADDFMDINFQIESEGPHPNLYLYQGAIVYENNGKLEKEAATINNMILRGCYLRNSKWITGIVMFTGAETKIMLNSGETVAKKSRLSRELNYYVLVNFMILFFICFSSGLISGLVSRAKNTSREAFEYGTIAGNPAKDGLVNFFVAVILYQSLVPISLYISIEIIKLLQAYFIYCDLGLYYERLDLPCNPKTWSISDDLGQVEYIFTDKTGTLTQNLMEFRKCTINGVLYGRAYTEALAGLRRRQGVDVDTECKVERALIALERVDMLALLQAMAPNLYAEDLTFVSKRFVRDLSGLSGAAQQASTEEFMLALSLCHSVLLEDDPKNPGKTLLKAQSPDEAALVGTARSLGFNFSATTKRGYVVDIQGQKREFQVLNTLEFNSTRKRMSAIIKLPSINGSHEPRVVLYCKGADSIIYSRLLASSNDQATLDQTSQHLEGFATEGLRTLCIARRELTWAQYLDFNERYLAASASLVDREAKMEEAADSIERELTLLGGTAIEDRLQDGVPESISTLAQAGIKLWVLTGDKVETAINIGFSCNLLDNEMELLVVKIDVSAEDMAKHSIFSGALALQIIDSLLSSYLGRHFQMEGTPEELGEAINDHSTPSRLFGVVIDGDALKLALGDPLLQRKFLLLCKNCKTVLCCRVSPAQKAAVVQMVKETLSVITLAIGDGSNDVAMIQTADIGVGIAGEEGRQAAMSSDYALGQFRYLTRLLLSHGRWSYKRFAEMIPCFFYKNINYTFAQFWYSFFNGFDGLYLFNVTYLMLYHLMFTSLPVITMGVFDQDLSAKVSMLTPQLYRSGILRSEFTELKFWLYICDGIYQSLVSFLFPYFVFHWTFQSRSGIAIDHRFFVGILVTTISCLSSNLYVLLRQYRWDWVSFISMTASTLLVFLWTICWTSGLWSLEFYQAGRAMYSLVIFWACLFCGVCVCLLPRFSCDIVQKLLYPKDCDIIRECVKNDIYDQYPDHYDPTDPERLQSSEDKEHTFSLQSTVGLCFSGSISNSFKSKPKSVYHDHNSIIDTYTLYGTSSVMMDEVVEMRDLEQNEQLDQQRSNIRFSLEMNDITAAGLRRSMDP